MTHKFYGSLSKTIIHKSSKSFTSRKHKYLAGIQYRTLLNGFPSSRSKDSGCILTEQSSFQQSYRLDPFLEKNEKFEMKREKKRYSSERFLVSLLIRTNVGGSSKVFTSGLSRVVIARLLTEGAALVSGQGCSRFSFEKFTLRPPFALFPSRWIRLGSTSSTGQSVRIREIF